MATISREIIQDIKERLDIISLVERYVPLQKVGSRFRGPCPFHEETKPSFYIDPNLGLYHCFGCQASGDIIDFYCRINGLDFYQAIIDLAQEAGIEIKSQSSFDRKSSQRKSILELNRIALSFYQQSLETSPQAKQYLKQRHIPEEIINNFQIGYAPDSWERLKNFLKKKGYSITNAINAGLIVKNEKNHIYDRFRNRIIFPILNITGHCIGFGGRAITEIEPKYLNTSENQVFKKGENLYGLYEARREIGLKKYVLLTEGYIDVIRLHQFGYKNSCGVLGTALTPAHVKKISNLCPRVILIFDGDEAGIKAALKSAQLFLAHGTKVEVVNLPQGEDIDSFLLKQGATGLDKLIKNAQEGLVFCTNMIKFNHSPREIIQWCKEFISSITDTALVGFYLPKLSKELGISEIELRRSLDKRERKKQEKILTQKKILLGEKEILKFAICFPEYREQLNTLEVYSYLKNKPAKLLWEKLIRYNPEEILYKLDEFERDFYIESLFYKEENLDPKKLWEEIKNFLKKKQKDRILKQAKQALQQAQIQKDEQKMKFYISQIDNLLKGKRELG